MAIFKYQNKCTLKSNRKAEWRSTLVSEVKWTRKYRILKLE